MNDQPAVQGHSENDIPRFLSLIEEELKILQETGDTLDESVESLYESVSPVLLDPSSEASDMKNLADEEAETELGNQLEKIRKRIAKLRQDIQRSTDFIQEIEGRTQL